MKHQHRHRGFICEAGLWSPQVQIQITPFYWGVSLGFSRTKLALKVGPVAVALWVAIRGLKAECCIFDDPEA